MSICISGWAMLNRQPAVIEDVYADARIPVRPIVRPREEPSHGPIRTTERWARSVAYWAARRNRSHTR